MSNFLTEDQIPLSWRRLAESSLCYVYNGVSMRPTFHPGQLLLIAPLQGAPERGDVVIFYDPSRALNIVHRVTGVAGETLRTRGDHNLHPDAWAVPLGQVMGRVVKMEVGHQLRGVRGGWQGLWLARVGWLGQAVLEGVRRLFKRPYGMLRAGGLVGRVWKPEIVRLNLHNDLGALVKFLHQGRTVATWKPGLDVFECKKPYDLVVAHPKKVGGRAEAPVEERRDG